MRGTKFRFLNAALAVMVLGVAGLQSGMAPAAESPDPQLAALEAGVQAAEAVRAVKRLQHAYAHYQEAGLWSDLAELFTADGVGQFPGREAKGKAELRSYFMEEAGRKQPGLAPGQLNTHLVMQPIVTLGADGRTAKGTWHDLAMLGRFGESATWVGVIYENDYVLDQGRWKIARVGYHPQYAGAYADDGHKAPAKWNIPYHFEARHVGVTIPDAAVAALSAKVAAAPAAVRIADLQQRLARLRDETEVTNLQHAFGYYLDRKLYDDIADLFASDGSMELAQRGVYVGPVRIRAALERIHGPTPLQRGELFDHILVSTVVTIAPDGTHAAARTTQLAQLGQTGKGASWEVGLFENRFVKQGGRWKLAAVRYFQRLSTDYDKGWAEDARPAPTVDAGFAPDRPPSQRYGSYPAQQSVGFSFAHPVTGRAVGAPQGAVVGMALVSGQAPKATTVARDSIAELQRQLRVAIGVDATENLMSSYGYYIDESAWDSMADTYGIAGAKELTGAGVYVGTERIRTALNLRGPKGGRSATTFTIHQVVQPVINVAADGMSAKARLRLFQDGGAANGTSGSWIGGIYENTANVENGEWKFGIQDLHHIFNASYRNGWARVGNAGSAPGAAPAATPRVPAAPVTPAAPAPSGRDVRGGGLTEGLGGAAPPSRWMNEFPPDRKIRARQYAFPEIVEPGFHYANPVSGRAPKELVNP